jgi:hypothetical protein
MEKQILFADSILVNVEDGNGRDLDPLKDGNDNVNHVCSLLPCPLISILTLDI